MVLAAGGGGHARYLSAVEDDERLSDVAPDELPPEAGEAVSNERGGSADEEFLRSHDAAGEGDGGDDAESVGEFGGFAHSFHVSLVIGGVHCMGWVVSWDWKGCGGFFVGCHS